MRKICGKSAEKNKPPAVLRSGTCSGRQGRGDNPLVGVTLVDRVRQGEEEALPGDDDDPVTVLRLLPAIFPVLPGVLPAVLPAVPGELSLEQVGPFKGELCNAGNTTQPPPSVPALAETAVIIGGGGVAFTAALS